MLRPYGLTCTYPSQLCSPRCGGGTWIPAFAGMTEAGGLAPGGGTHFGGVGAEGSGLPRWRRAIQEVN